MTEDVPLEVELALYAIVDRIGIDTDPATVEPPIPASLHRVIRVVQALRKITAALQTLEDVAGRLLASGGAAP